MRFGVATSTGDAEGEVIARAPVSFGAEALQAVLPRFLGTIEQVPPMVSALKHEGKPLYRYAREGVVIERAARPVTIHELRLIEQDVVRVDHTHSVDDLVRLGADVERAVLSRAVQWHCQDRVVRVGNETVVF